MPKFTKSKSIPVSKQILDLGNTVRLGANKRKMLVVPESMYLAGMSDIIKRDHFPYLNVVDAEREFLEALERSDFDEALRAGEKIRSLKNDQDEDSVKPTLEDYRSVITSEDNASFEQLMERHNSIKREKYERVYGAPALLADDPARKLLLMPSKHDPSKLNHAKAARFKKINVESTRLSRPELLPSVGDGGIDDIRAVYQEIMQSHFGSSANEDSRSVTTASDRFEMVPTTPLIKPGIEATPIMTWGNVEATPLRIESTPLRTPSRTSKDSAVKRLIKANISSRKADSPFDFDTKSLRNNKATEEMKAVMQSPVIPRTPRSSGTHTPRRPT